MACTAYKMSLAPQSEGQKADERGGGYGVCRVAVSSTGGVDNARGKSAGKICA